jgi:hypothetical protein
MSDRLIPHSQKEAVAGGSFYHSSSTKTTITRCSPNAGCPGGAGVDIKHNSYARRLNQLKAKGPARLGVVPANFGSPIPFNCTTPIYGGKTMKTSIVSNNKCLCPESSNVSPLYNIFTKPIFLGSVCSLPIGSIVYVENPDNSGYSQAVIKSIISKGNFKVSINTGEFAGQTLNVGCNNLLLYNPSPTGKCDLGLTTPTMNSLYGNTLNGTTTNVLIDGINVQDCILLADLAQLTSLNSIIPNFYISPVLGNPV